MPQDDEPTPLYQDSDWFECEYCGFMATYLEMRLRQFNELRCARCNGPMKRIPENDGR